MAESTTSKGGAAELVARGHLEAGGYEILHTNWRFKRLEVDIIARHLEVIVFVEVKYRVNGDFADPELSVGAKKQAFLVAAAHHYLTVHDVEMEARFDVIAITGQLPGASIRHLEGAFFPVAK